MGSVQGGHEGNIPVEAMRYCIVVVWVRVGLRGTDKKQHNIYDYEIKM